MSKDKLLPCPFCGGEAKIYNVEDKDDTNFGGSFVCCTKCNSSGNMEFGRKENFIDNWNKRTINKYKNIAEEFAYYTNDLLEGGDPDEAANALIEYGYTDENGSWIYEEE